MMKPLTNEELQMFIDLYFNKVECDEGNDVWSEFSGKIENFRKFANVIYSMGYANAM